MSENNKEQINAQIASLMTKYKYSMYGIFICVAVYIACLFWLKNDLLMIAVAVPMIILAFINNKYARKIKQLSVLRNQQMQEETKREKLAENPDLTEEEIEEEMAKTDGPVYGITNLNHLPKQYTVLDDVIVQDQPVEHIILSPYGIAAISTTDPTEAIRETIADLNLNPPIFWYEPSQDIADLAVKIQQEDDVVLTEPEIYDLLYRITGIK